MTDLRESYFNWMLGLVEAEKQKRPYYVLLDYLNSIDFDYSIDMDANRFEDGIDLRYRFGYDHGLDESIIEMQLDDHACSVLEMMVALSLKIEEHIMNDPDIGDRTHEWFWERIDNLGLSDMDDTYFDEEITFEIVERFLTREYKKNGEGGLFIIYDKNKDMRDVEIWCQMNWYLVEQIERDKH